MNGEAHTVIGILPPAVDHLNHIGERVDPWLPLAVELEAAARGGAEAPVRGWDHPS